MVHFTREIHDAWTKNRGNMPKIRNNEKPSGSLEPTLNQERGPGKTLEVDKFLVNAIVA